MSSRFVIEGPRPLRGTYPVQGNKNAALPLLAASLISRGSTTFHKMPRIVDVRNMIRLLESIGAVVTWDGESVTVDSRGVNNADLPSDIVDKLRGAILLLGSLAADFDSIQCALPGGCPLGRRTFEIHWAVFRSAGLTVREGPDGIRILRESPPPETPRVYLEETSVTATENALILFAALGGGVIENPAREPHVFNLVQYLRALGCQIELHPLYFEISSGIERGRNLEFDVPGDYIDAGTIAIAAAATRGEVQIDGIRREELIGIIPVLERFGLRLEPLSETSWKSHAPSLRSPSQVMAGLWPLFPTDLVSLAIVLATQSEGLCLVHDWMYEARMFFVDKLVRMGGSITMCDPHRVLVEGGKPLRGTRLESPDIRAGMALVVAGLCAQGKTVIEHAEVIERGYESVVERLQAVGARIEKVL